MAGKFDTLFPRAFREILRQLNLDATLHQTRDAGDLATSVEIVFEEMVGFVDNLRRGVIQVSESALPTAADTVKKGDYFTFVLDDLLLEWNVDEVRLDRVGTYELRVVGHMERL